MNKKRLTRDHEQRVLAGVLAGLAKYFGQDPLLFRVLAIAAIIITGLFPGVLLYGVAWLIMPKATGPDYTVVE